MAKWDAPEERVHGAINTGREIYEEVVTFYHSSSEVDRSPSRRTTNRLKIKAG
jgi:hypothetical protein